ncbi:MAG: glycosyltransferase family 39 protein [Deltaproteobacteria bacterium]|nr:glycosyltransferase family 39 protein [Deltaproteobacteria bacterium]
MELGLPLRPPGTGLLIALFFSEPTSRGPDVRLLFAVLGAFGAPLGAIAVARSFGARVGAIAGALMACATSSIIVSSSIDAEAPYLLVVLAALAMWPEVIRRRWLVVFGALNGLALLFRAEHALTLLLFLGPAIASWARIESKGVATSASRVLLGVALLVAPWQLHVYRTIHELNANPNQDPTEDSRLLPLEATLPPIRWSSGAESALAKVPAFSRRLVKDFVSATVAHRGRTEVRTEDLLLVRDAFGFQPEPLPEIPLVALYGPMNFYLANNPRASDGFSRRAFEREGPFLGGRESYPDLLFLGPAPIGTIAIQYPPHLEILLHGYRMGFEWLGSDPIGSMQFVLRKANRFLSVLRHGFTSEGLPAGLSGVGWSVDVAVPEGAIAVATELAWLGLMVAGLMKIVRASRARGAVAVWLGLFVSKLVVAMAFFGYARLGVTAFPVVALLVAIVLERSVAKRERLLLSIWVAGALAIEVARFTWPPEVRVDGELIGRVDSLPPAVHRDRSISVSR